MSPYFLVIGSTAFSVQKPPRAASKDPRADKLMVVDCLLPGQVRKLGAIRTFLTPRRPIKTTQSDCEIRGGEYVEFDRADYSTALKIWLPQAKQGDPEAQNYIGEIFEKGLGTISDYQAAATWYRKSAEQGYSRAQINLGQLYEQGLGVPQDMREALNWYRRASGLDDDDLQYASAVRVTLAAKDQQIQQLQERSQRSEEEVAALRRQLKTAQSELNGRQVEIDAARNKLEEIQEKLKEQDSVVQSNTKEGKRLLQRELQQEQARLSSRLAELDELESNLTNQASLLTKKQREAAQQNNQLQSELLQKQAEADRLRSRLQALNRELAQAREELRKEANQDAAIVAQLKAVEDERTSLKELLVESDLQVESLSSKLSDTTANLDATAMKYAEAISKFEQQKVLFEFETKRIQEERERLAQKAEVDVAEINKLRTELKKQEAQYAEQIENLTTKYRESQKKIRKAEQELAATASEPAVEVAALGPPSIELIEPPVTLTRGTYTASVGEKLEKARDYRQGNSSRRRGSIQH